MWCTSLVLSAHFSFFFFNDTATTEIYTLSLHDALPILMLEDKEFLASVAELIRENHLTAEKAFEFKVLEVRDAWAATGSPRLKDRLADLSGVAIRVIEHLMHRGSDELWEAITQPSVVVAREL